MTETDVQIIPAGIPHRFMWARDRLFGRNGVMAVPIVYRFQGDLSVPDLEGALDDLVSRHAGLRTTFAWMDRSLNQVVHPPGWKPVTLARFDCAGEQDPEKAAYQQVRQFLRGQMDVSQSSVRAALWRIGDDDHLFVLDPHHIITDAWSNMLLARDLATFYRDRRQQSSSDMPTIDWQYSDYTLARHKEMLDPAMDKHKTYLLSVLQDVRFPPLPPLPAPPGKRVSLSATEWFDLPPEQISTLREIAREERTTLFVLLLSLFFVALQEATGESDLAMGTIVANRARAEVQETVGLFANMMVVRTNLGPNPTTLETIRAVRRSVLRGLSHSETPYARLPVNSWRRGATGEPRDVVFHMLAEPPSSHARERVDFGGLGVRQHHIPDGLGCRFEFEMLVVPAPDGLEAVIKYSDDRFDLEYVRDIIRRYLAAMADLCGDRRSAPFVPAPAGSQPRMTPLD